MEMNCTNTIPYAKELVGNLDDVGKGLVISTGVSMLLTLGISLISLRLVIRNVPPGDERWISSWLVGICPIVGVTSFVGIISPRSIHIDELVSAIYVSLSVAVFFRLMILYHGGEETMCRTLKGVKLPMSKPPFCCCICLRNVYVNRRTLRRIKLIVYQVLVVRPVLLYADAVIKSEEKFTEASLARNPVQVIVSVFTILSTMLSLLGLITTFRLSLKPLKAHGVVPKFLYVKLILLFCDPQKMILGLVVTAGLLPCSPLFHHPLRGETLKFVLLCFEMLLVSLLGMKVFGRETPGSESVELKGKGPINHGTDNGALAVYSEKPAL
ncbi:organic solute transporter subunit alpha-like [Liolophura sinensis]|uniref:organic solute transporter subunit alpha-like n=1 Tax=Liolophura sinensis TaxID=3198878 RepID=UPI0031589883